MLWHDFFYFSKGERRGLTVLLCLIVVAGILLIWKSEPEADPVPAQAPAGDESVFNASKSTGSRSPGNSSAGKSSESVSSPAERKNTYSSKKRSSSALPDADSTKQVKASGDGSVNGIYGMEQEIPESGGAKKPESAHRNESVSERVKRLTSSSRPSYPRTEKFKEGTVVELNTADTAILKKVPGIGSAFARRIINYRNILGGYYSVMQLSEVYGIDEEKYNALASWFSVDPSLVSRLDVNNLSQDSLRRHPYINYGQAKIIVQLRRQKGKLAGWENLLLLNEFTESDKIRLQHYLSFE